MNGPEHFRETEYLIAEGEDVALAAATVDAVDHPLGNRAVWAEVLS